MKVQSENSLQEAMHLSCFAIPNVNHSILRLVKHWGHMLWLFCKKNLCSYMHRLHICISLQRLAAIKLTAFFQESKENPKQIQFARSSLNTSVLGSLLGRLWALHGTGGLKQLGAGLKGLKGLNQWWTAEYGWILLDVILKYLCALKLLKNILKCLKFQLCSNGSLWLRDSRITGWPEGIREVMQCSIPLWEFCGLSRLL